MWRQLRSHHRHLILVNVVLLIHFVHIIVYFQVAGITANTEQHIAPIVPLSGPSSLQLTNEHMSIVASENAG